MRILQTIQGHSDLVALNEEQRRQLCQELRDFLIKNVSKTGGHVASNLGVVELTVALETVYDTAVDRVLFDVGHQSYIHKILTGRQSAFGTLRTYGGLAGFPKPSESITDAFTAGHASSSVSIALGMARARTLQKDDYSVVAVLGDGAATGGLAYEALNDAAVSGEPIVVVLNDNALSIDRNVGGMASHLRKLRARKGYLGMKEKYRSFLKKIPGGGPLYRATHNVKNWFRRMLIPITIFDNMGFTYLGPVDGHDTETLIEMLQRAKAMGSPVVLHVVTQKGKGYVHAQEHPKQFHAIGKFDPQTGEPCGQPTETFSDAFGDTMLALAALDERICAITAAMPGGTGLLEFKNRYPSRLFDVGIAEEHAVAMAGGLAKQGMIPVVALYSTFLQRAYDMILQDVAMQNLHAVFAVDRAGLVGADGETHHGVFDVGFLRQASNLTLLCPASLVELNQMILWAALECDGPVAVRYPRGGNGSYTASRWGHGESRVCTHRAGSQVAIITYGTMVDMALDTADIVSQNGIYPTVLRLLCINPLPIDEILTAIEGHTHVVILEETAVNSGIGPDLTAQLHGRRRDLSLVTVDLGTAFVPHGSIPQLHKHCGMDPETVAKRILEVHPR